MSQFGNILRMGRNTMFAVAAEPREFLFRHTWTPEEINESAIEDEGDIMLNQRARFYDVMWTTDPTMRRAIIGKDEAVFRADALTCFKEEDLPRKPLPNELIESPRGQKWQVVASDHDDGSVVIALKQIVPR